jgi:mRNA-degrading endonuclease RelE of RelBE toxin-antitoxin system
MNEIVLTQRLKDDYKALPESVQKKLKKQIRFLAENPKHQSLQVHRIQGTSYWEFYIDKSYRCIFRQDGSVFYLLAAGHHKVVDEFSRK